MRRFFIYIYMVLCAATTMAQSAVSADKLFQAGNYMAAQQAYKRLLQGNPRSALYLYRYARCAQELGDYQTAIDYFGKAGEHYTFKYFCLGEIYMQLWRCEEAVTAYRTYLASQQLSEERVAYINAQIRCAEKRQRYLRRVEKLQVIDSVDVRLDSMLSVCPLSLETGTLTQDSLSIVYTNQRGDRRLWAAPCDSAYRIVSAQRLLNHWTTPDTLPATVNMATCQQSPYVLSDGVTLYFASNDTNGLGGLDLYVSRYNTSTNTYTRPENLGFPYNSEANEYFLIIDETRHIGYFATDRFSVQGRVRVYSFVPTEPKAYWHDLSHDSLVAYAQLRNALPAEHRGEILQPKVQSVEERPMSEAFRFVLNDSTIYTSLEDFRSPAARDMYQEWQRSYQQWIADSERLSELRRQYSESDMQERQQLAPTILKLEITCQQQSVCCSTLLKQLRLSENLALTIPVP